MRTRITIALIPLALAAATAAAPAFAQSVGRAANDGGMIAEPSQGPTAQYNRNGAVVPAPGNEGGSSCATRFHSFDPATGSYMGRDGRRHPCQ